MNDVGSGAADEATRRPFGVWLVTDVYPPGCGGSGWSTHALAKTLSDHGHEVEVIGLDPAANGVSQRVFEGIKVSELGVAPARRSPRRRLGARDYGHDALEDYLSGRLEADDSVKVLHAQHLHSGAPTVAAAARYGRASVQTLRDYWPVCLHGTSWWNGGECSGCSVSNLGGCMSEYWSWPRPASRIMVGWANRRLAARRAGVAAAGRVITVSDWVRRRIEREIPEGRFEVLPNIVDADAAQASARGAAMLDLPWSKPYLIAAGKLHATKGFDRMLTALAASRPDLPVVIAGSGPERENLERQAASLGLESHFPGWVEHSQLLGLIGRAHAFLLPGSWSEPMSRLLLETLAIGAPVVAWPSGGNPEHLNSGVDAFVVADAEALRAALDALDDAETSHRVAAAGEALARRTFSPQAVYPQVRSIYVAAMEQAAERHGA
jgi:glycogen(starch) synthase